MEYKSKIILLMTILVAGAVQARDASDCLDIADNNARLSCYDRALGYRNMTAPERPQILQQTRQSRSSSEDSNQSASQPTAQSIIYSNSVSTSTPVMIKAQQAYDQVVADSISMLITKVKNTQRKESYFTTNTNRKFKRVSDRQVAFRVNDRVELQPGVLGSMFLVNQVGLRIKVKEIK
ncbi:hypothetical protein N8137_01185 [Porticoccaceae bacterium]|nr:hypothetical protein [Porticoccaceae bacterium]MDC0133556.1 hypothetical protein [Porticoccaceae bacterium]MDC1476719.1 hypothetical protein [Porticoccaceae bacterium]